MVNRGVNCWQLTIECCHFNMYLWKSMWILEEKNWGRNVKYDMIRIIVVFLHYFLLGIFFPPSPKKKNYLFPSERPGEIFFPTMRPVHFLRNDKWIKKIFSRKKKWKKRKMTSVEKRKMLGHSSTLTFFIYIYKSQIHVSTDVIIEKSKLFLFLVLKYFLCLTAHNNFVVPLFRYLGTDLFSMTLLLHSFFGFSHNTFFQFFIFLSFTCMKDTSKSHKKKT